MANKPTIAFRVSEGQKSEWEQFAENNDEYDSLSHLIRVAVSHEMSDQYGPNDGSSTVEGGSNEQIGELVTAVNKMQGRLEDVEDGLADATEAVYATPSRSARPSHGKLLNAVPEGKEAALPATEIGRRVGFDIEKDIGRRQTLLTTLHEIEDEGAIESFEEDGTTRYFKGE
jgi:hypothetical protein